MTLLTQCLDRKGLSEADKKGVPQLRRRSREGNRARPGATRLWLLLNAAFLVVSVAPAASAGPGLTATIIRDQAGVPHIYGDTDAATAFGLGFAHAEDDMDNIEDAVLLVRGRLSSKLGEEALPQDRLSQMLQGSRIARETYRRDLSKTAQSIAEGYAAGINRYLKLHPNEGRSLDGPVTAYDVVAFSYNLTPLFFGLETAMQKAAGSTQLASRSGLDNVRLGSNALAIAPSRAPDGVTRVVANSHQPWDGMLAWYEAGFHSKSGLEFYGGQIGLIPFPFYGHNASIGWGLTLNRPNLTDIYALQLDPANPRRYKWNGGWRDMSVYPAHYTVKQPAGARTIDEPVEWTVHGPVFRVGAKAFAIHYSSIGEARGLDGYLGLIRSHTASDLNKALDRQNIASINIVYGDRDGHIGYVYNARLPRREARFVGAGVLPGDQPAALWTSYLPESAVPHVLDPSSGFVFNGNNGPFLASDAKDNPRREDFPAALGIDATATNRGQRLFELLSAQTRIDRKTLLDIKYDSLVSRATPYITQYLQEAAAIQAPAGTNLAKAVTLVRDWDRSFDNSSKGAALATFLAGEAEHALWQDTTPRPAAEILASAVDQLTKAFGTIDPPLGDLVRLRHGSVDLPVPRGGPDVVRAINAEPDQDGRLRATVGDSLILLMEWGADKKVHSWASSPYGAAPARPESPHFADQSKLFLNQELRPAWFYEADVRQHAERVYTVTE